MHLFFLSPLSLFLANPYLLCSQQQDGPEPVANNGEPFHFLPTAPDVLFCKGSPPMKKVIMTVQPDVLQSASKRRQISGNVAPPSPDQEKEDHRETNHQENSSTFPESIRI